MVTLEQIVSFLEKECGVNKERLRLTTDIFDDLRVDGDDFSDLMEGYSATFNVNMDTYLWYFHCNDEGVNIWSFIFKPPNKKVNRIAVTPQLLLDYANDKKWGMDYPAHTVSNDRKDITYSNLLWGLIVVLVCVAVNFI